MDVGRGSPAPRPRGPRQPRRWGRAGPAAELPALGRAVIGSAHTPASDPCPAPGTGAPEEGPGMDPQHPAAPGSVAEEEEGEGGLVPAGGCRDRLAHVGRPHGAPRGDAAAWQRGRGRLRGNLGPPRSPGCRHRAELLGSLCGAADKEGAAAPWRLRGGPTMCDTRSPHPLPGSGGGASRSFAGEPRGPCGGTLAPRAVPRARGCSGAAWEAQQPPERAVTVPERGDSAGPPATSGLQG